jgi:hypothetical protein
VQRPQNDPLDQYAYGEREQHGRPEGDPERITPVDELPADEGAEHRHLALGEIYVIGRDEDHDKREREQRVDCAVRQSRCHLLKKLLHSDP